MLRTLAVALALAACLGGPAQAQDAYPSKPIRLVVAYPPGALTDPLARAIGERLAQALGQPAVIDNRPQGRARSSARRSSRDLRPAATRARRAAWRVGLGSLRGSSSRPVSSAADRPSA